MTTFATPLLTVRDTARLLNLDRGTVYRLIKSGDLPAVRVGGSLRIDSDLLRDYLYGKEPSE
jgi:excisionase family DNA binding protein